MHIKINMDNKDKIIESAEELKRGLELLSRERKVVMPHNKAFDLSLIHISEPTRPC